MTTAPRLDRYVVAVMRCRSQGRCEDRIWQSAPMTVREVLPKWEWLAGSLPWLGGTERRWQPLCPNPLCSTLHPMWFVAWAETDANGRRHPGPYEWLEYRCQTCRTVAFDPFTWGQWPNRRTRRVWCPACSASIPDSRRWLRRAAAPPADFFERQMRCESRSEANQRQQRILKAARDTALAAEPRPPDPTGVPPAEWVHRLTRAPISQSLRFRIMRRDGFRCRLCGQDASHGVALRIDHIVPWSKGGADSEENLWTLCQDCNAGKGAEPLEWERRTDRISAEESS